MTHQEISFAGAGADQAKEVMLGESSAAYLGVEGFRVLGFWVLGFRGLRVSGLGFSVGFRILRFRVEGFGFRV